MAIELTLFDSDRYGSSEFLGQVVIELGSVPLDDEPEWFLLSSHEEIVQQLVCVVYSFGFVVFFCFCFWSCQKLNWRHITQHDTTHNNKPK